MAEALRPEYRFVAFVRARLIASDPPCVLCLVHTDLLPHACHEPRDTCRIMHHVDSDAGVMYKQLNCTKTCQVSFCAQMLLNPCDSCDVYVQL